MLNLPDRFLESMKELLADEYDAYIESFQEPRLYGLRVNTSKLTTEEFERIAPFPIRKIPFVSNGYYYDAETEPAKHPYYYAGLYYLQEPSAMTPADCIEIHEHDKILDLCAAPGGKATELGARLSGTGVLLANDISASRAKALLKNIEVQGISNCYVTAEAPQKLLQYFPEAFDVILIDAPCSGEGMFRKEPALIKSWEERGPVEYHEMQKEITKAAVGMLKPGGRMLYSTCTFSRTEDEQTIEELLMLYPDMQLEEIGEREGFQRGLKPYEKCVRLYPHKIEGEGHFLASLRKIAQNQEKNSMRQNSVPSVPKDVKGLLAQFLQGFSYEADVARILNGSLLYRDESLYLLPQDLNYEASIRYLRTGLLLGTVDQRKRFEPSAAFAMSLKQNQYRYVLNLSSDGEHVKRYLKGETISLPEGWEYNGKASVLVCVDGYPLGWGKVNGTLLKNKYQTGWRMQT